VSPDLAWPGEEAGPGRVSAGVPLGSGPPLPVLLSLEEAAALLAELEELRAGLPGPERSVAERLLSAWPQDGRPTRAAERSACPPSAEALAAVALAALRDGPDAAAWSALHRLRLASPLLRGAMNGLIERATPGDADLAAALGTVASELASAAAADPVGRARLWDRERFAALLERWREAPDPEVLWSGSREWARLGWIGDDALHDVLGALGRTEPRRLAPVVARLRDPHSIASALGWLGAARRFRTWHALLEAAPPAFADNGSWSGDCLVPMLLAAGHEALGGRGHRGRAIPAPSDVARLAEAMAACVAARPDAVGLGRWWAPLAAACVASPPDQRSDAEVRAGANEVLLRALARRLPRLAWDPSTEAWAASREGWCLRAAAAMAAAEGTAAMPAFEGFVDPWKLSPDEVHGERGAELERLAGPFLPMEDWPHGPGAALLGLPFAAEPDGAVAWARLWHDAACLREIVEFGWPTEEWGSAASRAADLLRLAFAVGLAALDRVGRPPHAAERAAAPAAWLGALFDAAREMRAIDGPGYEDWTLALRVLALHRARHAGAGVAAPARGTEPTLATVLASFGGDAVAVVAAIVDLAGDGVGLPEILDALRAAGIDPAWAVETTTRLADADPQRGFLRGIAGRAAAILDGRIAGEGTLPP